MERMIGCVMVYLHSFWNFNVWVTWVNQFCMIVTGHNLHLTRFREAAPKCRSGELCLCEYFLLRGLNWMQEILHESPYIDIYTRLEFIQLRWWNRERRYWFLNIPLVWVWSKRKYLEFKAIWLKFDQNQSLFHTVHCLRRKHTWCHGLKSSLLYTKGPCGAMDIWHNFLWRQCLYHIVVQEERHRISEEEEIQYVAIGWQEVEDDPKKTCGKECFNFFKESDKTHPFLISWYPTIWSRYLRRETDFERLCTFFKDFKEFLTPWTSSGVWHGTKG